MDVLAELERLADASVGVTHIASEHLFSGAAAEIKRLTGELEVAHLAMADQGRMWEQCIDQREEAFDAARRWGDSIVAVIQHPDTPKP